MLRLLYLLPIWVLFLLIRVALIIIGIPLIALALLFKAYHYRPSKFYPDRIGLHWKWKILYLWDNEEDSILAGEEFKNSPAWFRILYWTHRNPVNNWRYSFLGCKYNQEKLKYITYPKCENEYLALWDFEEGKSKNVYFYMCWQGIYCNIKFQINVFNLFYLSLWLGSGKLYPSAKFKIPNYQLHGVGPVGPSFKFKRIQ